MTGLPLRDDTKHVNLQGRQYSLFNIDLGEGIVRDHMVLGAVICAVWAAVMWLLPSMSGVLPTGLVIALWIAPPWLVIKAALMPDHGDRPRYALWFCRVRYLARRNRPMIPPLGHRPINRWLIRAEPLLRPSRSRRPFTVQPSEFVILTDKASA